MDIKRELALLKSKSGKDRAALLREPPKQPTRKQLEILQAMNAAGGSLPAEDVHYRTGLVLTARRWARLMRGPDGLVFTLSDGGHSLLETLAGNKESKN